VQKDHQIEIRDDRVAPAFYRCAQHPIGARQEHFMHQPQAIGDVSLFLIRRNCREPKIIIRIMMRKSERIRQGAAEAGNAGA
jgi:hypothetical protein